MDNLLKAIEILGDPLPADPVMANEVRRLARDLLKACAESRYQAREKLLEHRDHARYHMTRGPIKDNDYHHLLGKESAFDIALSFFPARPKIDAKPDQFGAWL